MLRIEGKKFKIP